MNTKKKEIDKSTIENYVIISSICLGFIGGAIFYFIRDGKPLSAVFISFALGSLIYEFLGGITKDTGFTLGLFRLGGSAAFIIGAIFFFNNYIFNEKSQEYETIIKKPDSRWFPFLVDNGLPGKVTIKDKNGKLIDFQLENNYKATIREHRYDLVHEGKCYSIKSAIDRNFSIGKVDVTGLNNDIFNKINGIDNWDLFQLYPNISKKNKFKNRNFPFYLKAHEGYLDILLYKGNNVLKSNVNVERGVSFIFNIEDGFYIVFIVEANHPPQKIKEWYSKYLVGKFNVTKE